MLTLHELTELLVRADRLGLTTYKDGQAAAWKEVLDRVYPDLDKRLATEAIEDLSVTLDTVPPRGISPGHLRNRALTIAATRRDRTPIELPAGLTITEERAWARAWSYAVTRGADRDSARAYSERMTGLRIPELEPGPAPANIKNDLDKYKNKFGRINQ